MTENTPRTFRLDDRAAIVTGGGSGIGRAIAECLAAHGARVAVLDLDDAGARETVSGIETAGGAARFYRCDVGDGAAVATVFHEVERDWGWLRILVNNAGIAHVGTVENTAEDDLDRLYRVNVKGVYHCLREGVAAMERGGGGTIVNMGSIAARLGIRERFAYSMTKGAVLAMTLSVARDFVDRGIRCNCICPARVHTPFVDGFLQKNYPGREEEMLAKLAEYQPIGRMGRPEEVATLALYLCSDEAAFVTGGVYDIDGGVTWLR